MRLMGLFWNWMKFLDPLDRQQMKRSNDSFLQRQRGQSLVEVALIMPILVLLIAGIVEFSNLVITQNRVSTAARAGARFGANGGEDEGMILVALNAVTETMDLSPERWDMWALRGQVNSSGDGFADFQINHVYGMSQTARFTSTLTTILSGTLQAEVLYRLQQEFDGAGVITNTAQAADLKFVGTLLLFDTKFILGLDSLFDLVNSAKTIRQLHIMRRTGLDIETTNGCTGVFPFGVEENIRSLTEGSYPPADAFDYPIPPPVLAQFVNNEGDVRLDAANEGYVFKLDFGYDSGDFSWLKWRQASPSGAGTLNASMQWPGNSHVPGIGFEDFYDVTDTTMHVGDRVALNNGSDIWSNGAFLSTLRDHVDDDRSLRVVTWREGHNDGNSLQINGFAIFQVAGFHMDAGNPANSWLLLQFIRHDNSCGQNVMP